MVLWYSHAFQYRQNHFDALEHRRKPQSTYWYRVVGLTLRCYGYWNILATDLRHDQKPISHFYVAVVTCVLARFSWTAVRAKALQIAKQDEKEPATFPTPYAINSLKEKKMKNLTRYHVSRLCQVDEGCPWLPLCGWYGCVYAFGVTTWGNCSCPPRIWCRLSFAASLFVPIIQLPARENLNAATTHKTTASNR